MKTSAKKEVLYNTEWPPAQAEKKRKLWISPELPRLMGREPMGREKPLPASTAQILAKEHQAGVFSMAEYMSVIAKKRRAKPRL